MEQLTDKKKKKKKKKKMILSVTWGWKSLQLEKVVTPF